jgi:hypothetical protein
VPKATEDTFSPTPGPKRGVRLAFLRATDRRRYEQELLAAREAAKTSLPANVRLRNCASNSLLSSATIFAILSHPQAQAHVFRGEVRASRQGLGLGLHIASQIAKAHDGVLTVTSTPEETKFAVVMPLRCKRKPLAQRIRHGPCRRARESRPNGV